MSLSFRTTHQKTLSQSISQQIHTSTTTKPKPITLSSKRENIKTEIIKNGCKIMTAAVASTLFFTQPVLAKIRLPEIDPDPNRCERAYTGNTIGQANAVSFKVLDLRECNLSGKDLAGKTLSGALLADSDLSNSNLSEAVLSKAYAVGARFDGANMSNSVLDRIDFSNASFKGANLTNSIITGSFFDGANFEGVNFEDAVIGSEDVKRLCLNPTLIGDSRNQIGCRK